MDRIDGGSVCGSGDDGSGDGFIVVVVVFENLVEREGAETDADLEFRDRRSQYSF